MEFIRICIHLTSTIILCKFHSIIYNQHLLVLYNLNRIHNNFISSIIKTLLDKGVVFWSFMILVDKLLYIDSSVYIANMIIDHSKFIID